MKKHLLLIVFILSLPISGLFAQNIGGIGAQLIIDTSEGFTMPRIMSLVRNTPAWDSLKATDYIMEVNDVSCKNKTIEEVVELIRGEAGTEVKVVVADTKYGARPRPYTLTRVGMQLGPTADPSASFYTTCQNEVKQLKKTGAMVVKTYNSECGNFFFNFDAEKAIYKVRIYTLADKPLPDPGYTLSARVFDTDHESDAMTLKNATLKDGMYQVEGIAIFSRNTVGVVNVNIAGDTQKCHAMYVVIYK